MCRAEPFRTSFIAAVACLAAVSACGPVTPAAEPVPDPVGRSIIRLGEPFGGLVLTTTSTAPVDGAQPELSISCSELGPSIFFSLVRAPAKPPSLRGNLATLALNGGAPISVEMAWAEKGNWMPRDLPGDRELQLVRRIADARLITLAGLEEHAPTPVTWSIDLPKRERERFLAACLDKPPE